MPSGIHGPCLFERKARVFSFIGLQWCILLAAGCATSRRSASENSLPSEVATDEIGRQVKLPKHPERIISLAPSVTEILYLIGADDRLVGDTTYCNWPEGAKHKPKIGDLLNPNYEAILAAGPDLVIASTAGNDRAAVFKLTDLGLPVYVSAPRSVEKIFQAIVNIGHITDRAEAARALVEQMKQRLGAVEHKLEGVAPTRAFFMTWFDPLLAPGKYTFENDVLQRAGVASITADIKEFYPRYSLEQLIAKNPDAILMMPMGAATLPNLKQIAGWRRLRAVQTGHVYIVSDLLEHPSPRFVDGVEELAQELHPECFR